jgi:hypothetical protein
MHLHLVIAMVAVAQFSQKAVSQMPDSVGVPDY